MSERLHFFKSSNVKWPQGVRLQKARWHSCMRWGWPAIRSGERLARYADYWVLSICWRSYGVCWHLYPKAMRS